MKHINMKHIKTFESFLSESKINEADVWDKIRNYFPNPANPEDYITTKIMSLGKKTPFTVVIDDMIGELKVKESDAKLFASTLKNYLKNFDPMGKLKALVFMNESSYTSAMDDFTIALSNVKKVGKNVTCDATIVFTDKSDIQAYLDNELDNVNGDILDWAQSQDIVKGDDYSSGFDGKPSIAGNKVTGKFTFFAA